MSQTRQHVLSTAQSRAKTVFLLKVEEIVPSTFQVRKQFVGIKALSSSLLQTGQIQPIVVSPKNSAGYYVIQKGERRWRACHSAGLSHVEAIINDQQGSELEEIAGQLVENIQREDLSPLEIAEALDVFIQAGWTQSRIAQQLGKSRSFVSTHLSLLKMAEPVLEVYRRGVTKDTETLNNLRLLYELDPHKGFEVCQTALQQGISRQQSRELFNMAKQDVTTTESRDLPNLLQMGQMTLPAPETECEIEQLDVVREGECSPAFTTPWQWIRPDRVVIVVNILYEKDFIQGALLVDRIDHTPHYVWVKVKISEQEGEKIVRVPVADIELVNVTV